MVTSTSSCLALQEMLQCCCQLVVMRIMPTAGLYKPVLTACMMHVSLHARSHTDAGMGDDYACGMLSHMAISLKTVFSLPGSGTYHVLIHARDHIDAQHVACLDGGSPVV